MSKNTGRTQFRKVDVDEYDENNYQDEQTDEEGKGPDEGEVQAFLNQYPFAMFATCCNRHDESPWP